MRAGNLRDRITLLTPTPNPWGEHTEWKELATLHAEIDDKSGDLTDTAGADTQKRTITATIRYRKHLKGNERIVWLEQSYAIAHIERDKKRRSLTLTCESEQ